MKTGDEVVVQGKPEYGTGKVVRFYANHGTVLVNFDKKEKLTYCDYNTLVSHKSEK